MSYETLISALERHGKTLPERERRELAKLAQELFARHAHAFLAARGVATSSYHGPSLARCLDGRGDASDTHHLLEVVKVFRSLPTLPKG